MAGLDGLNLTAKIMEDHTSSKNGVKEKVKRRAVLWNVYVFRTEEPVEQSSCFLYCALSVTASDQEDPPQRPSSQSVTAHFVSALCR